MLAVEYKIYHIEKALELMNEFSSQLKGQILEIIV